MQKNKCYSFHDVLEAIVEMIVSLRAVMIAQMKTLITLFTIVIAKTGSVMSQVSVVIKTGMNQENQMMYHNQM